MTDKEIEKICEDIQAICYVVDVILIGIGLLMLCARWCI